MGDNDTNGAAHSYTNGAAHGSLFSAPERAPTAPKKKRSWLAIVALLALAASGYWLYRNHTRSSLSAPFEGHLSAFSTLLSKATPSEEEPYVRGRLLIMKRESAEIDPLFFALPDELRATSPEEVGSIAFIFCGENEVGQYTNGAAAIQLYCEATLIDKEEGKRLGSHRVVGPPPQFFTNGSGAPNKSFGGAPDSQLLVEWLKKLPHRESP